ncbi:MAG: bifunctional (p)ppGpp synthetase/guanosine-3',5'-bis(diphosphate) 3'-pyrophosphohydrolase [Oscillospiraceae bacterium]|jgi:GTP pyrophosphokinase|nr:bifunctional (p)ppGpp synthetase/guanosine-3',5'-bis(diphosphate) 3'-pyrophosphohydrolase [Oscillospiraceae bacterium]
MSGTGSTSLSDLLEKINTSDKQYDAALITKAYAVAAQSHLGQKRKSGEPYIVHPLSVAMILLDLGMDTESIAAAILHDVVEDNKDVPLEEIRQMFGGNIAVLVDGVTKITQLAGTQTYKEKQAQREHQQAENIRKMFLAMNKDIRVIIIKLADRIHNMRTLEAQTPEAQMRISKETLEVYAPIAHRLGIRQFKEELEDAALQYLDHFVYKEITDHLALKHDEREKLLESIKEKIHERLEGANVEANITARVKSVYGIYRKTYLQGKNFDEIYDIYAVRVIVNDMSECYTVLGLMHDTFKPIPNRLKDYISLPKPNMYQSLHTTVLGKEGVPFEIQIRTWEMHYTAEYGIAAHWKYKAGIESAENLQKKTLWIQQLLEAQDDAEEIKQIIKTDLTLEEVFVLTPKGDAIPLPTGSTVIDFAYSIHSEIGNHISGAKADGHIVPITHELQTGEVIEVLTSRNAAPSRDWLDIAKTSNARGKIRAWFKREKREENIIAGREELEREFKRNLISFSGEEKLAEFVAELARKQRFGSAEDLYAAIGYGGLKLSNFMQKIREDYEKRDKTPEELDREALESAEKKQSQTKKGVSGGVVIEGVDNALVKYAQCCNPVPGDRIIAFITRGHGFAVHKQDCPNFENSTQPERWHLARWAEGVRESYRIIIELIAYDRPGLVSDVTTQLNNMHVQIEELQVKVSGQIVKMLCTAAISNLDQLQAVCNSLKKISGVISAVRTGK